ncbi:nuclease A inhibitor family protein [uncultured Hymenobacter sp.]|uniref:nuclease A inhibitor family protein n=1 Tax=uncultured Hymenobacter sp. TaxID=170016 RepID=UPI0035CC7ADA
MPSIFSRIVAGELPAYKVAEDADHLAFLDITPLVEGHTLVIPKREVDYIFDLPAAELAALHVFAQRVARGVRVAVPCRRIGVAVIGLEVPHAHIHLIPMQKVGDMNFANPKIKVPEARMQELASAIAAQVPAAGKAAEPATEPAAMMSALTGPAAGTRSLAPTPPAAAKAVEAPATPADDLFAQLQKLTAGLVFVSESEVPLEAVRFPAPAGALTPEAARQLLSQPAGANGTTSELSPFLREHTADQGVLHDAAMSNRYKALQSFLKQELTGTQVYRFGSGPQLVAVALGQAPGGELLGFKTKVTQT